MDFQISEDTQTILELINEFVDKELLPLEQDFLHRPWDELMPTLAAKREMVKQMELWAPLHPKEYGGVGLGLVDYGLVCEALARSPWGCSFSVVRLRTRATSRSSSSTAPQSRRRST